MDQKFSIELACEVLGVSRSGYHAWIKREPSARAIEDRRLWPMIQQAHSESDATYGARRIQHDLADLGERVGRDRIWRIMRSNGISGRVVRLRRRIKQLADEGLHAVDLVNRDWHPDAPNELWIADITQINTWEGPLYIAAVMDVFSRRIVGWSMQPHMRKEIVIEALEMAIAQRRPAPGLVHHSDHGAQYTSYAFGKTLRDSKILPSMGRVRTCADNAVAESFFATLKKEKTNRRSWPTRAELQSVVFEYIEGRYNTRRRHSKLGYLSPVNFEAQQAA
ncbi:MAG: IS3 family transposase [Pseudomonadales bacterium]|nr:IS3 family transposase [Thermoleophilia bacterium]MCB1693366.1 IS3 family transposase [Pseudomonadales bacterium]